MEIKFNGKINFFLTCEINNIIIHLVTVAVFKAIERFSKGFMLKMTQSGEKFVSIIISYIKYFYVIQ